MVLGAVACLAASVALGGCGDSTVEVAAPTRAEGPAECGALLDAVPHTVDGQPRRDVSPHDALAAAWGDPGIVLRCGVAKPPALHASSSCAVVNDVGWFAQERDDAYRFTTVGRSVFVSVDVPYEYEPAADALVDLAAAVRSAVPRQDPCV